MLDGTGYPNGLKDKEIPLQARILCMVDIFDALTAGDRPYRPSIPVDNALDILRSEVRENHLDNNLVDLFISEGLYLISEQDQILLKRDLGHC
jgi:HD-GYP domain-containing protein (c-di-GMP phosphodiesterase class II)